jgi:hypothetical protein
VHVARDVPRISAERRLRRRTTVTRDLCGSARLSLTVHARLGAEGAPRADGHDPGAGGRASRQDRAVAAMWSTTIGSRSNVRGLVLT